MSENVLPLKENDFVPLTSHDLADSIFKNNKINTLFVLIYFVWHLVVALQSLYNLGSISTIIFFTIPFFLILLESDYASVFLTSTFYLPFGGLNISNPYVWMLFLIFFTYTFSAILHKKWNTTIKKFFSFSLWPMVVSFFFFAFVGLRYLYTAEFFYTTPEIESELLIYTKNFLFIIIISFTLINIKACSFCIHFIVIQAALTFPLSLFHYLLDTNAFLFIKIQANNEEFVAKLFTDNVDNVKRILWSGVDPNYFGASLLPTMLFAFMFVYLSKNYFVKIFYSLCFILIFAEILGSFSRSTFVCACLSLIIFLVFLKKINGSFLFLSFIGVIGFIGFIDFFPEVADRILGISDNISSTGGSYRIPFMLGGLSAWSFSPFWGFGLGAIEMPQEIMLASEYSGTSHSTYIQIALTNGAFGLLLLFAFFYVCFFKNPIYLFKNLSFRNKIFLYGVFFGGVSKLFVILFIPSIDLKDTYLFCYFYYIVSLSFSQYMLDKESSDSFKSELLCE